MSGVADSFFRGLGSEPVCGDFCSLESDCDLHCVPIKLFDPKRLRTLLPLCYTTTNCIRDYQLLCDYPLPSLFAPARRKTQNKDNKSFAENAGASFLRPNCEL